MELGPWAARRRSELLTWIDQSKQPIAELDRAIEKEAMAHGEAARLMTHPGVGPLTALAFVLTVGPVERFPRSRKLSGYWGLDPMTDASGQRTRIGSISKQGNSCLLTAPTPL